jgi:hypothetical protein
MYHTIASRRRVTRALLAATVVVLATLAGASGGSARPVQATLTLDDAAVNATWKESWLTGNVTFSGTVSGQSELSAFLRRIEPAPRVVAARTTISASPGTYTGTLRFPNRALPGTYLLHVSGTSGGEQLTPVEQTVTLPAPAEGIVDRSWVSRTKNGPPVRRIRGPVRELHATFRFVVPPAEVRSVRLLWRTPQFNFVGEVRKRYSKTVTTFIRSGQPLPAGTWYCLLTVNEIVTKRVSVRVGG